MPRKEAQPIARFSARENESLLAKMSVEEKISALFGPEPSKEDRDVRRKAAQEAQAEIWAKQRANAYPVFGARDIVRCDIGGWRFCDARVIKDAGPPSSGERSITIEKVSGPRAGERAVVRRDRVRLTA